MTLFTQLFKYCKRILYFLRRCSSSRGHRYHSSRASSSTLELSVYTSYHRLFSEPFDFVLVRLFTSWLLLSWLFPFCARILSSMLGNSKRKSRWSSKGFFGSKSPSKVVVMERSSSNNRNDIGDVSVGSSSNGLSGKTGIRSRIRRSGSKVLSLLGWSKQSGESMSPVGVFVANSGSKAVEGHQLPPMVPAPASVRSQSQLPEMPRNCQRARSGSVALYSVALPVFPLLGWYATEHQIMPPLFRCSRALLQAM